MKHLRVHLTVPPERADELIDAIYRIAARNGTLSITGLIDEYREDVTLEVVHVESESRHGHNPHSREDRSKDRWRATGNTA